VIWALVDSVAGRLDVRAPDGVRIVLDGRARVTEAGGRHGRVILSLPLAYVVGLSCVELKVVIAGELGGRATRTRTGRRISAVAGRVGRRMVGLERSRSRLRRPLRSCARAAFGFSSRLARRRALAATRLAAGLFGDDAVLRATGRADSLEVAFGWFWSIDVDPFLDRGWRPPIGEGFRSFLDAPHVSERIGVAPDDSTGDVLADAETVEARLLAGLSLVWVAWQQGAPAVVLSVWDGHARRERLTARGLRVSDLGRQVGVSIDAHASDPAGLVAELAGLGSGLGLALAADGWRVGRVPGGPATLSKGGVELRPDLEISRLAAGELTSAVWVERCERLGIADLRLERDALDGAPARTKAAAGSF
jgi:hypothetical protein